jgi:hypothetical protein
MFRFALKTIVLFKLLALSFAAGMGTTYALQVRRQYGRWGLLEGGDDLGLAGDELVAEPNLIETRRIDIDASPEAVWPWLAQLGYGRGGWYALPVLDRPWSPGGGPGARSAESILPEHQDLAQGDLVPTHPHGGFEARVVEPGESLVLYIDDDMTRAQLEEAMSEGAAETEVDSDMLVDMPPYRVSWAFVLEDLPGGRTRLIERLRADVKATEQQLRAKPLAKAGLFVLMKSQLEGIKDRAEGTLAA